MNSNQTLARSAKPLLIFYLALGIFIVGILLPGSPLYKAIPDRDSGVFLYIGEQILEGKIPYRDIWDHKTPIIYYINALALLITRNSTWGLWIIEYVFLFSSGLVGFSLLRRAFGLFPAIFGTTVWLTSLIFLFWGGNFTEEYALLFQFLSLHLVLRWERKKGNTWNLFLNGLIAGISFLLRPNLIGTQVAIAFYLLTKNESDAIENTIKKFLTLIVGAMIPLFISSVYFLLHGSLKAFIDQAFVYNFYYSNASLREMIASIFYGVSILTGSGGSTIALLSWGYLFIKKLPYTNSAPLNMSQKTILDIVLLALPLEMILSSISGSSYHHYFIPWLPTIAILASFFAFEIKTLIQYRSQDIFGDKVSFANILLTLLLIGVSYKPIKSLSIQLSLPQTNPSNKQQIIEFIKKTTSEKEYVLLWGAETSINFISHRKSPCRFVYQYPLYLRGYQKPELVKEFYQCLEEQQPKLIIDTSPSNPIIPPINPNKRRAWKSSDSNYEPLPDMKIIYDYIHANYEHIGLTEDKQWPIYLRKSN